MDSDLHQQQMSSGLMRYQSAPSSYFTNLINSSGYGGDACDEFLNPRPSSPETDGIFARYMSSGGITASENLGDIDRNALGNETVQSQFVATMKNEEVFHPQQQQQQQQRNMIYQSQSQPDHNAVTSMAMDRLPHMKMGGGNNSNLIRQSSSPAGLFSHINVENGYAVMRGMGNFGAGGGTNAEASFSSASRLRGQMDFSSGPPSSSGLLGRISEIEGKSMGRSSPKEGFPTGSWDDSAILSENFLKELGDNDRTTFSNLNSSKNQNGEGGSRTPTVLSHHLSLPTSSAELSAMEKLLHFQDSVPLRIRAKRGCATHPRSIAERVRRTRISERMRKLQVLVPNMDKQTNTADMLDLAVDYIKDLQKQVKTLSDNRSKCTCSK